MRQGEITTGFVGFINKIQMTSLASLNGQVLWFFLCILLGIVDAWLLTSHADAIPLEKYATQQQASWAIAIYTAHNSAAEQMRQVGIWVCGILVSGVLGKSINNNFGNKIQRESAIEYAPVAAAKAGKPSEMHIEKVEHAEHVGVADTERGNRA